MKLKKPQQQTTNNNTNSSKDFKVYLKFIFQWPKIFAVVVIEKFVQSFAVTHTSHIGTVQRVQS